MAKVSTVWGIDIGNSALKAIRCRKSAADPNKIELLAFDYIEHSKVLSQPGAEPAEVMAETLKTFLSRNSTKGDRVAISISGQSTISRFLRLPPVDPKKVPDILKYEAKQWLPFALDDVIWDFQPIGVNDGADGLLDSEIGMFAMKKEAALKSLAPYLKAGIDVDCIQSSPLTLYNYITFDQLRLAGNNYELDPENQPDHVVILNIGTDSTDVVVTNGFSIWVRSIIIGGNTFTKALTKNMKLTFSKAEYLKRNAAQSQDPKAVFQAMRPVFNEMLAEVNRSLEFYQNTNRNAKFTKIVGLGNAMKLPGLRQFLTQNLGYEVVRANNYSRAVGDEVLQAPVFRDNILSFGVSYGLAIQALNEAPLSTNLIPKEVVTERIIREKKPWALAICAALLLGWTLQFGAASRALQTVKTGDYGSARSQAESAQKYASGLASETSSKVSTFQSVKQIGQNLTVSVEGRIVWNELLKAINFAMPVPGDVLYEKDADRVMKQDRIFIQNIDAVNVEDLSAWFKPLQDFKLYLPEMEEVVAALQGGATIPPREDGSAAPVFDKDNPASIVEAAKKMLESERTALITGPAAGTKGKVVQIIGYHYHNGGAESLLGAAYLRNTFIRRLKGYGEKPGQLLTIKFPAGMQERMKDPTAVEEVTMEELGISFPTLLSFPRIRETIVLNPKTIRELYIKAQKESQLKKKRGTSRAGMVGSDFSMDSSSYDSPINQGGVLSGFTDARSILSGLNDGGNGGRRPGMMGGSGRGNDINLDFKLLDPEKDMITLRRFEFVVQFAWVETPPSAREEKRKIKKEEEARGKVTGEGGSTTEGTGTSTTPAAVTPAAPADEPPVEEPPAEPEPVEE
ncbi:MAG: type IV pilus assembly protein PilM [Planctomycetaceae bacterium]|jgi:type IV pilus assembly protein PilM|nr:type IV pilus assembly protein PilM [Planctomycetaceae bacterium]